MSISLVACECCGCVYLFTAYAACTVAKGTLFLREVVCRFKVFFVIFDYVCTKCFRETFFRKAIISGVLNVSLYLVFLRIFRIYIQCLLIISLRFGNVELYVPDNGMHDFFGDCGFFNRLNVSVLSILVFLLYSLSTNFSLSARERFNILELLNRCLLF